MKKTYKTSARYRLAKDKIVFGCICLLTSVTMVPLFLILSELLRKGYKQLNLNLFTEIAPTTMEAMIARMNHELIPGGILNGLTGTVLILSIAIMIAIPLGILVGIYLAEN